jgi:nitrous oxidase accessory protein
MRSHVRSELMARLALALAIAILLLLTAPRTAAQEVVVGPGEAIERISDAIATAPAGATIRVLPGTYRESPIRVDRPVRLIGEGRPTLDGGGDRTVVEVVADGVEIRGFVIRGAGVSHLRENAGVYVAGAGDCVISDNRLEENFFGVYLARSTGCRVVGNEIRASGTRESTSGNGIHLWNASGIDVTDNVISGHRDGIYLEFAKQTTLSGNTSEDNLRYGLHFMFSNETAYMRNTFRRNGAGVAVMYSKGVRMVENRFEDNWGPAAYGLLLKEISESEVTGNRFRRNTVGSTPRAAPTWRSATTTSRGTAGRCGCAPTRARTGSRTTTSSTTSSTSRPTRDRTGTPSRGTTGAATRATTSRATASATYRIAPCGSSR